MAHVLAEHGLEHYIAVEIYLYIQYWTTQIVEVGVHL